MLHLLIHHKVHDYAKWKPGFDGFAATRKANGSKGGYLFRITDDPNEILILLEWDDLEKARRFTQSQDLREGMQRAGVSVQPEFYFLEEVERVPE